MYRQLFTVHLNDTGKPVVVINDSVNAVSTQPALKEELESMIAQAIGGQGELNLGLVSSKGVVDDIRGTRVSLDVVFEDAASKARYAVAGYGDDVDAAQFHAFLNALRQRQFFLDPQLYREGIVTGNIP